MDSAGSTNDFARGYQVFVSNDGVNFGGAVASGTGTAALIRVSFPTQNARFIRVVQTGSASFWWSIAEFNVFGGGGGDGGTGGASGTGGANGTGGASGTGGAGGGAAVQINSGGPAVAPYVADVDFAGGNTINHANAIDLSAVTDPAPTAVYQTARIGNFSYTVSGLAAGSSHTLRLHFAETYWSAAGSRIFNVTINGAQALTNFDILAAAGAKNKAIVRQFTAAADSGGAYLVQFTTVKDNSLLSGLEVQ